MRVVGYGRRSKAEEGKDGYGLGAQRAAVEAEAARRGWDAIEWVEDNGVSAAVDPDDRPALGEVLAAADRGEVDAVVVARMDRVVRSVIHLSELMDRSMEGGWLLVLADQPALDVSTPSGRFVGQVLAAVAELERQMIRARTKEALAVAKSRGSRLGRAVEMDGAVRSRIVAERAAGRTLSAIADGLTDDGVPTVRGGARWWPSTVRAVLESVELDDAADAARMGA